MAERWRPSFDAEFRDQIENFLESHDEIPYSDAREFTKAIVKLKIMEIETRDKSIEEAAKEMIRKDLEVD